MWKRERERERERDVLYVEGLVSATKKARHYAPIRAATAKHPALDTQLPLPLRPFGHGAF